MPRLAVQAVDDYPYGAVLPIGSAGPPTKDCGPACGKRLPNAL